MQEIDPGSIQWDTPPQTVPPAQGSRQGGVIITDPTVSQQSEREDVRLQMEGERLRIAQEKAERDRLEFEQEQAKAAASAATQRDINDIRAELQNVINKARRAKKLSNEWFATGLGAETARGFGGSSASDVAALLTTIGSSTAFDRLQRMRAESPTGGALGQVAVPELEMLRDSVSSLNQSQSDEQFRQSMDIIIESYQRVLDKLPSAEPTAETPVPPQGTEVGADIRGQDPNRPGSVWDQPQEPQTTVSGTEETFSTPEDRELQARITEAYNRGASLEELQGIASEYNRTIPISSQEALDNARREGRALNVENTGRRTQAQKLIGPVADSPVGAFFIGGGNAVLSGYMDELVGELGGDAETAQAAKEYMREEYSVPSFLGEMTGQGLQMAAGGATLRAVGAGSKLALGAAEVAQGALYGSGEANEDRLLGAVTGGASTVIGQQIGKRLIEPGARAVIQRIMGETGAPKEVVEQAIIEALEGGAKRQAASAPTRSVIRDADRVIEAGRAEGVPVMTSDVRPPRTWIGKWLQGTGEKLPFIGTGRARAAQQEARANMIEGLLEEYNSSPNSIDLVTADFLKTRGDEVARLAQQKRDVFSSVAGGPPPDASNALAVLDAAIQRYGSKASYTDLATRLNGWRNDLANAGSIADVEDVRKAIGDAFQDQALRASSTAMKGVVDGPEGLYNALRTDMTNYIRDNAGDGAVAKWREANTALADFAIDLNKNTVARVLRTGEATPEEARALLFSNKPSDVRALFSNLSPDGQRRARGLVVQDLIDKAGGIEELSTAKFTSALRRARDTVGVTFSEAEANRMAGVLRLLQATRRAEQASVTTPTGQSTLPFVGASSLGYLTGGWAGALGIGGATMAGFSAYESRAMRNLLTALARTRPDTPAERNVLENINRALSASGSVVGGYANRPNPQPDSEIVVR